MIYGGLRRPILVLFLTDGRLQSDWEIEEILIKTSRFPVFWQFIGLYGEEYGVLNHLDEIDGPPHQNAAFLKMEDFDDFMDSGFYRHHFRKHGRLAGGAGPEADAAVEEMRWGGCYLRGSRGPGAEAWDFFGCQMMRRL